MKYSKAVSSGFYLNSNPGIVFFGDQTVHHLHAPGAIMRSGGTAFNDFKRNDHNPNMAFSINKTSACDLLSGSASHEHLNARAAELIRYLDFLVAAIKYWSEVQICVAVDPKWISPANVYGVQPSRKNNFQGLSHRGRLTPTRRQNTPRVAG